MRNWILLFTMVLLPSVMYAQYDDDMYFTPSTEQNSTQKSSTPAMRPSSSTYSSRRTVPAQVSVYNSNPRNTDEYNRRGQGDSSYAGSWQTSGGYNSTDTTLTAEVENVNTDNGRDLDDEDDYYYSRRILRFHSPRVGIALSSPWYWDLVYDYGCYDYLWDAYVYDPFYWNYGWSYGWGWGPWSAWYGSIWGWHHPYAWSYWGWGWNGGWSHHPHHDGHDYVWNRGRYWNRGTVRNNYSNGQRIRTSALANGGLASTSRGTFAGRTSATSSRSGMTRQSVVGGGRGSAYSDYARQRGISSSSRTSATRSRMVTSSDQSRSTYTRPSSSRTSTYTPNRTSSSRSSSTFSGGSRSSSSFGGGSRGGFGGGSRGGFGGGGSRGGGRR